MKPALKVALLWHGDREARDTATLEKNRLEGVAEALEPLARETYFRLRTPLAG